MSDKKTPMVFYWMGSPMESLSRDELLEVIEHLATENRQIREDRNRWAAAGNAAYYLLRNRPQ